MRVGVFGGTFDPVHLGHLILAEQCREQAQLDQVWFIPAARPPHKLERNLTPFPQRVEMLTLAIAGQPAFRIDELEKDRSGPSYTVDTLEELHRRHPDFEVFLILGSDTLEELPHWREPKRVIERTGLLIHERPGFPVMPLDELRAALHLTENDMVRYQVMEGPRIGISSRDLRRRAEEGRSLRYQVSHAVECYIREKRLYHVP